MAQRLADAEHGNPLAVGDRGKAVAQAVEGAGRQAAVADYLCEMGGEIVRGVGAAPAVGYHKAQGIEGLAVLDPVLEIAPVHPLQQLPQVLVSGEGQPPHRGWALGALVHSGAVGGGARLADVQHPLLQVHIVPLQSADLAAPHPQIPGQLHHRLQAPPGGDGEQVLKLLRGVEAVLGRALRRGIDGVDHVLPQHVLLDRQPHGAVEQDVVLADGVGAQPLLLLAVEILLDLHRGEALEQHPPQDGLDMVVNDLLIAVDRSHRPGGPDHVVEPVVQPLSHRHAAGQDAPPDIPGGEEVVPHQDRLLQCGEAAGLFHPVSLAVHTVMQGHIIAILLIVESNIGGYSSS